MRVDNAQSPPLRVLIVEDNPDDAELLVRELRRGGFKSTYERVDTPQSMISALDRHWDLIVADYNMPGFGALEALKLIQERGVDIPFILVSGVVVEETAVEAMRRGAHDYLSKKNLARLGPAVSRELREFELRRSHRKAEETLKSQHALLTAVMEGTSDAVFVKDRQGRYLMINSAGARALGGTVEEVLGKDDRNFLPSQQAQAIIKGDLAVMQSAVAQTTEDVLTLGGATRTFLTTKAPYRDQAGKIIGVIGIARDISDRKRGEELQKFLAEATRILTESLDYEKTLSDVARLAVGRISDGCTVDLIEEGQTLRQVAAAHRDRKKENLTRELGGRRPLQAELQRGVEHVIRTGISEIYPQAAGETAFLAPGVEPPELLRRLGAKAYLCLPLVARGSTIGAISFFSATSPFDNAVFTMARELGRRAGISVDNARLYRNVQDAVRARDDFMSIASHELRTPLSALILQLQGVERSLVAKLDQRVAGKLGSALRQTARLTKLVESLLDVSRITTGRIQLQPEELDLAEVVREVINRFSDEATRAGCSLTLRGDDRVDGMWDKLRVDQLVTNLISNAVKYGPGKAVEVTVAADPEKARISVRDYGIGIAHEDIARIFGRFERAVPLRHYGGFGLGLYIARQFVEAHGGSIQVSSQPGEGSTFTVELPRTPVGVSKAQRASLEEHTQFM